ncbi:hypothetical protein [Pseudomonas alliivorans]
MRASSQSWPEFYSHRLFVQNLGKINGDLGRVAGLLKLWLAEKNGQGASSVEVERMMVEFRELQAGIREKMSAVVFSRKREG